MPASLAQPGTLRRARQDAGLTAAEMAQLYQKATGEPMTVTTLTRMENAEVGRARRFNRPDEIRTILDIARRHGAGRQN